MSLVSWPLPALPWVCPALAKNGVLWLRPAARVPLMRTSGCLQSRTSFSCAELSNASTECDPKTIDESKAEGEEDDGEVSGWSKDEIDAISALFARPMRLRPAKPVKPVKERALPLPSPHRTRMPVGPTTKRHVRLAAKAVLPSRSSFSDRVRKDPEVLVGIAREIAALPAQSDVSLVLDRWTCFFRKGSLSMTIRELGHLGLPERALQTLCWAQKQKAVALFPDDRTLASTIEVLARFGQLRIESELEKCVASASRPVLEAMASGFIRAGKLSLARKILLLAKDGRRTLDPSLHAKLMLEAARTPAGYGLASALLDELGAHEDFHLAPQDCTAIMKVCTKLGRFDTVESLFNWYMGCGGSPSVVMYTAVIHSRHCAGRCREGMALVWEMEGSGCLLDLPAYRVMIRLCLTLDDLSRAARYLSRMKEAGFVPTGDIYRDMIRAYAGAGRVAKCRQLLKEAEQTGLKLDRGLISQFTEKETESS